MYTIATTTSGRFLIRHPIHPGLAWSGASWVQHCDGQPATDLPVLTFDSEQAAEDYATENYLYPRRD